MGALIIMF